MSNRPNHRHLDEIAWNTIRSRRTPGNLVGRPNDYDDLADDARESGFYESMLRLVEQFYLYRRRSFFEVEPPIGLAHEERVFLAALAEFMCRKFDLGSPPEWTRKPEYYLEKECDWSYRITQMPDALFAFLPEARNARRRYATPEFKRRNIIFEARNLISV